jgi:hypothetical protein
MFRIQQSALLVSTLLLSWLLMQAVHEFGHMAAARASGGRAVREVLHPLAISRTDVQPNPNPLIVVWGGPLLGIMLPLIAYCLLAALHLPGGFLRFFAGFCLIANGAYIGFGSFQRIGDCNEMLRYGSSIWTLWLFGLIVIPFGLLLWSGMESYFGFRTGQSFHWRRKTIATTIALLIVVIIELLI